MALTATPRRLVQVLLPAGGIANRFTNNEQKQVIKEFCFCNQTIKDSRVSVAIVPLGETLSQKHYILFEVKVKDGETVWFTEIATVMELGDSLYVGSTRDVSFYVSSAEFITVI